MRINWQRTKWVVATALIALLLLASGVVAQSFPRTPVGWLLAQRLSVSTISTLRGDVSAGGNLSVADNTTLGGDLTFVPQPVISVTQDATITPSGTYQPLSSAGTVGTASIAPGTAGDLLVLINTTATSIVLTDTGTLKLTGNLTLGQYDSVTLWSDGANWIQLATANN